MSMYYSPSTGGFYDSEINGADIPGDSVEITREEHLALLDGQSQGQCIAHGDDGIPYLNARPAPSAEQLAAGARSKRNALLAACDWTQLPDAPKATSAAWAAYRQALRNLPQQPGFPGDVTWPEVPHG